mmetsp:Transcript_23199/g.36274  ORF Transcript_23199/g.36274 Transcript_23199/m.36274 type:complete len:80 (+) Transcript_23199:412-651(+)
MFICYTAMSRVNTTFLGGRRPIPRFCFRDGFAFGSCSPSHLRKLLSNPIQSNPPAQTLPQTMVPRQQQAAQLYCSSEQQ